MINLSSKTKTRIEKIHTFYLRPYTLNSKNALLFCECVTVLLLIFFFYFKLVRIKKCFLLCLVDTQLGKPPPYLHQGTGFETTTMVMMMKVAATHTERERCVYSPNQA